MKRESRVSIACLFLHPTNHLSIEQENGEVKFLHGEQSKEDDKIKIDCFIENFRKDIK